MVVLHQQNVQLVLARGVGERRDGRRVVRLRIGIGRPRGGFHGGRSRDRARRHRLRTVTNVPPRERRLTRAVARDASARFRPGRAVRSKRRRDGRCRAKAVIRAFASPATRAPAESRAAPVLGHGPLVSARAPVAFARSLPRRAPRGVARPAHSLPKLPRWTRERLSAKFSPREDIFAGAHDAASACSIGGEKAGRVMTRERLAVFAVSRSGSINSPPNPRSD